MTVADEIEGWGRELEAVAGRIAPRFARLAGQRRALAYLKGLLAPLERKNGWHMAEAAGDATPDAMQDFLSRSRWDAEGVRDDLQAYVAERLGDDEAVLVLDGPLGNAAGGKRAFSRRAATRSGSSASTRARQGASRTARSASSSAMPAATATP